MASGKKSVMDAELWKVFLHDSLMYPALSLSERVRRLDFIPDFFILAGEA